jgi:DNA polymerase-4
VLDEPTLLHADADAFFASVEQRDAPELRGRPVIVGPGVVMAASYEAKAHGIRGGMGGGRARRLCPDAVFVPPRFDAYVQASRDLFDVFRDTSPEVEGLSLEEAFLDVRGLERISGTPLEIAVRLKREVRRRVGLTVTVGVARTRVLAKMASGAAKPDGLLVVRPGEERAFLHPLPVERVWGVGQVTAAKLRAAGIATVGEIAERGEAALIEVVGPAAGRQLHAIAHNRDNRRVRSGRGRRSVGAQSAFGRSPKTPADLDRILARLVQRVTRRMRAKGRTGRTVTLRLRFSDYTRATRSRSLAEATAASDAILVAGRSLLAAAQDEIERRGITLIGITVSSLGRETGQLALDVERRDRRALDPTLDELAERFGPDAVSRGGPAQAD